MIEPTAVRSDARGSNKQPARGKLRNGQRHGSTAKHTPPSAIPAVPAAAEFVAIDQIRSALVQRQEQLQAEHRLVMVELRALQRNRQVDAGGEDQADAGTKTHQWEQELTLTHGILERIEQVERAINRIDEGTYGQCERCGNSIPIARLEAFPAATLCVSCKQRQERR